jgi:hypothetical protein
MGKNNLIFFYVNANKRISLSVKIQLRCNQPALQKIARMRCREAPFYPHREFRLLQKMLLINIYLSRDYKILE